MHSNLAFTSFEVAPDRTLVSVDCAAARRIVAAATDVSPARIFASTRLADLVGDSLLMEVLILELEEYLGCEADRAALLGVETVADLSRFMNESKALTRV